MKGQGFSLEPFPTDSLQTGVRITGNIARNSNTLFLSYELLCPLAELVIPAEAESRERRDFLWKETCFEFFLGKKDSDRYWEFNLSPSGHWNVYSFTSYRQGMREEPAFASLPFMVRTSADSLRLSLGLDLKKIIPAEQALQVAVSAVIKERDGKITYWALTHPGPDPDFHRRGGFVIEL